MWEDYRKKRLIMNIILAVVILAVLAGLLLAMIYVRRQTKEHDEHLSEIYMQQQQEQAEVKEEDVKGTIRRVFDGKLRLRREPSFDDSAICGVTAFDTKKAVKKFTTPDGVLYQTADGYFVSGRPGDVEFIPE